MIFVDVAAAAVTAVLAVSSGRNMLQTVSLARQNAQKVGASSNIFTNGLLRPNDSIETVVAKVQTMKRKDLLQLYFASRGPQDVEQVQGEWDGCLLDNNSWVMTSVTAFLTDRLFGRGRKWNGKEFGIANDNNQNNNVKQLPQGVNRFYMRPLRKNQHKNNQLHHQQQTPCCDKEHVFDMRIQKSKLGAQESSLVLDYTQYQSPISLWRTMMDEIRIIPLEGDTRVMIGLGYMAWSGGRFNASPFLLYRKAKAKSEASTV